MPTFDVLKLVPKEIIRLAMISRYFKIGNISCCIVSMLHFLHKISVRAVSLACP